MRHPKILIAVVFFLFASLGQSQELRAGRDYELVAPPQPTETAGKVEVIEFFSYMCPHCAHFEPKLVRWAKNLPKDVVLRRMPVIFRPQWEAPARLFFTLEALGEVDRLHGAAFTALQEQHVNLMTEAGVLDWAVKKGLDHKKFSDTFGSFGLRAKVQRAKQMSAAYGIPGVPALVVAGKYRTPDNFSGDQEDLLKLVDALIAKARSEQGRN